MPHPIEPSTLRILHPNGQTVGTGFLVAPNLAVTCAHVVELADAAAGYTIQVQFTGEAEKLDAVVLPEFWSDPGKDDVAILQIDKTPTGVFPLPMERAGTCKFRAPLYTFGYAQAADEDKLAGSGEFRTYPQDSKVFQFRMHEADHGHSGAPVLDVNHGVVIGMIQKGNAGANNNAETAFAIPTETIWKVCPRLRPPIPVLPKRSPILEGINLLPYDYDVKIQNFLTVYLGDEKNPVPFGGRDDALRMLDNWLVETTPYLLLAAPAGRGKSALLVRWLESLSAREDLALVFVPVSIRFGTNMERVFYAALAARLAFLHGDDVPASPETSTAVYRGLVSDYLSKPLANGKTLLVVLDGLDEATDWQAGADFMPGELPAGVRVVISARFLAGDADSAPWLRRLNWERNGLASAPTLTPLYQDGVGDVLFKMGCPLDKLSTKVDIVAELYRLSEGDPLLVGLYVSELWAKGEEVTRLKTEDLTGIQPGYKGYFDRWWDDQKKLWGKDKPWLEKHVRTIRCLLAGALGPLFKDDFQALDPELETDYISDALDVLQRFIIGDNQNQGYTFSHSQLGLYFWDTLTLTEQTQIENRFLACCKQTYQEFIDGKRNPKKKAEVPVYVVRNYGAHLVRANQPIEKWLPLIYHQQWAQAWFTVEGAYGGYLQDVQRVWGQCKEIDRQTVKETGKALCLDKQIRCALIESSIHSLAGKISSELVTLLVKYGIWTLPQTWVYICQMPESMHQRDTIIELLPLLSDEQLLEAVKVIVTIMDEWDRATVLCKVALRLPIFVKEALVTIQKITGKERRGYALSDLAQHLPAGELSQVLEDARHLDDDDRLALVLVNLAERMPEKELGQVLEVTRTIIDEGTRAWVLGTLAKRFPEEALVQLLETGRMINDKVSRTWVLIELSQRLPEITPEALTAVRAVDVEATRASMLSTLTQYMPALLDETLQSIKKIGDEESRVRELITLAQSLPRERLGNLLEVVREIKGKRERAYVLGFFAHRLPEIAEAALEAARDIQEKNQRTYALKYLANCLPEIALEVIEAAQVTRNIDLYVDTLVDLTLNLPKKDLICILEAAQKIESEAKRARILTVLARNLQKGQLGQVLEAARAVDDKEKRGWILNALAQYLPEITIEALETVRTINDESESSSVFIGLIEYLSKEQLVGALEIILALNDERVRPRVLSTLVEYLSDEELMTVLEATQTMGNEHERAQVLSALVEYLSDEELKGVLETTRTMGNEHERAQVLCALAQYMSDGELSLVLEAARAISDTESRINILIELARRLPDIYKETLDAAASVREKSRMWILVGFAIRLPELIKEILAVGRTISNELDRVSAFQMLVSSLPEEQLGVVFEEACKIEDEWWRAQILYLLSGHLPKIQLGRVVDVALEIDNEGNRAKVLSTVASRIAAGELTRVLDAALEIGNEWTRAMLLRDLAKYLPETELRQVLKLAWGIDDKKSRAQLFNALAERIPEAIDFALETAQVLENKEDRDSVLGDLVHRMPVEKPERIIEVAKRIRDERTRSKVLGESIQRLPKEQYIQVLKASQELKDDWAAANVFTKLVPHLPEWQLVEVLRISRTLMKSVQINILSALAQRQPELTGEAMKLVGAIQDKYARARVLSILSQTMLNISRDDCYSCLETTVADLSHHTRQNLLSDISLLLPALYHIGVDNTSIEIYRAIRDAITWWP